MKACVLLIAIVCASWQLQAQVPQKFNYQAVVRNNAGAIVANQNVSIRFTVRDGSAAGTPQYSERHATTTNAYGLINLQVGSGTVVSGAFTAITWHTSNKFLQVEADITGGTNYTSLATVELIAVPFALQSAKAKDFTGALTGEVTGMQNATVIGNNTITNAKLADNAVSTAKIVDNNITTAKISDNAIITAKITDNNVTTAKIADNAVTAPKIAAGQLVKSINGLKDDVVITATGGTSLSVAGNTISITSNGDVSGVTAGAGLTGGGTMGDLTLSAAFGGNGTSNTISRADHTHIGQSWSVNTGTGLTLHNNDAGGIGLNLYSYGTGYNAAAVSGQVLSTTGQSVGIFGATNSSDPYGAGVFGQATRTGGAKGVWGYAPGNNTFAIYGDGAGSGSYAGFFQGRVHVNGTLSKAAGSFKIDHPLDPTNKYLSHSFVESPDMMNVYNGNIVLDANGEATVTMPDYFEALNKEFRYQLTAVGKPSPNLYIAQEMTGNRFRIAGGAPGGKISWMVTGIRHDAYANEHRIPVVEEKPAAERGQYLYKAGQANGRQAKPAERGVAPSAQDKQ
jgi:hypothetical protein